jgi:hypothetical protein
VLAAFVAVSDIPVAPVLAGMLLGVVVATAGHIVADRRIVALGIGAIFLATLAMVVFGFAAYSGDDTAGPTACPPGISGRCN